MVLVFAGTTVSAFAEEDSATSSPEISVWRGDSQACKAAKKLQIRNYARLRKLKEKGCLPGKEASCAALETTLTNLCEQTNKKLVSACVSPWMLRAAGLDAEGSPIARAPNAPGTMSLPVMRR